MNKVNNFQIIENNSTSTKWITFLPNNTKCHYGAFLLLYQNFGTDKTAAQVWITALVKNKNKVPKSSVDISRNPTLTEYLTLKKILQTSGFKYNKKTQKLIKPK